MPQQEIKEKLVLSLLLPLYLECKTLLDAIACKEILKQNAAAEINRLNQLKKRYEDHLKKLATRMEEGYCQSFAILHAAQAHPRVNKIAKHEANLMRIEDLDPRCVTLKGILRSFKKMLAVPEVQSLFSKGLSDIVTHQSSREGDPLAGFSLFSLQRGADLNPKSFPFEIVGEHNAVLKVQSTCIISGNLTDEQLADALDPKQIQNNICLLCGYCEDDLHEIRLGFDGLHYIIYDSNYSRTKESIFDDEPKPLTYCSTFATKADAIKEIRRIFSASSAISIELASLGESAKEKYKFSLHKIHRKMIDVDSQRLLRGHGLHAICTFNPKKLKGILANAFNAADSKNALSTLELQLQLGRSLLLRHAGCVTFGEIGKSDIVTILNFLAKGDNPQVAALLCQVLALRTKEGDLVLNSIFNDVWRKKFAEAQQVNHDLCTALYAVIEKAKKSDQWFALCAYHPFFSTVVALRDPKKFHAALTQEVKAERKQDAKAEVKAAATNEYVTQTEFVLFYFNKMFDRIFSRGAQQAKKILAELDTFEETIETPPEVQSYINWRNVQTDFTQALARIEQQEAKEKKQTDKETTTRIVVNSAPRPPLGIELLFNMNPGFLSVCLDELKPDQATADCIVDALLKRNLESSTVLQRILDKIQARDTSAGQRYVLADALYRALQVAQKSRYWHDLLEMLLHEKFSNDRRALHIFALSGHAAAIKFLLHYKVETCVYDKDHATALFHAVANKHTDAALTLLAAESQLDYSFFPGENPLYAAVSKGNLTLAKAILDKVQGRENLADVWRAAVDDLSLEGVLQIYSKRKILEFLLQHAKQYLDEYTNIDGMTPLHYAAKHGKHDFVAFLLEHGADPTKLTKGDKLRAVDLTDDADVIKKLTMTKGVHEKKSMR